MGGSPQVPAAWRPRYKSSYALENRKSPGSPRCLHIHPAKTAPTQSSLRAVLSPSQPLTKGNKETLSPLGTQNIRSLLQGHHSLLLPQLCRAQTKLLLSQLLPFQGQEPPGPPLRTQPHHCHQSPLQRTHFQLRLPQTVLLTQQSQEEGQLPPFLPPVRLQKALPVLRIQYMPNLPGVPANLLCLFFFFLLPRLSCCLGGLSDVPQEWSISLICAFLCIYFQEMRSSWFIKPSAFPDRGKQNSTITPCHLSDIFIIPDAAPIKYCLVPKAISVKLS